MPSTPPGAQASSLDILVVDDEPMIREFMSDLLTLRGHRTRTADSPKSAMVDLQAQPCDLMFTDIRMPRMDGLDLAHSVRGTYPQTKIVVMSGHVMGRASGDERWESVDAFIGKPFSNTELTQVIEDVTKAGSSQFGS